MGAQQAEPLWRRRAPRSSGETVPPDQTAGYTGEVRGRRACRGRPDGAFDGCGCSLWRMPVSEVFLACISFEKLAHLKTAESPVSKTRPFEAPDVVGFLKLTPLGVVKGLVFPGKGEFQIGALKTRPLGDREKSNYTKALDDLKKEPPSANAAGGIPGIHRRIRQGEGGVSTTRLRV